MLASNRLASLPNVQLLLFSRLCHPCRLLQRRLFHIVDGENLQTGKYPSARKAKFAGIQKWTAVRWLIEKHYLCSDTVEQPSIQQVAGFAHLRKHDRKLRHLTGKKSTQSDKGRASLYTHASIYRSSFNYNRVRRVHVSGATKCRLQIDEDLTLRDPHGYLSSAESRALDEAISRAPLSNAKIARNGMMMMIQRRDPHVHRWQSASCKVGTTLSGRQLFHIVVCSHRGISYHQKRPHTVSAMGKHCSPERYEKG